MSNVKTYLLVHMYNHSFLHKQVKCKGHKVIFERLERSWHKAKCEGHGLYSMGKVIVKVKVLRTPTRQNL